MTKCPYCNGEHEAVCHLVKAIEYFENGQVKRVEFKEPANYYVPSPPPPTWPWPGMPPVITGWPYGSNPSGPGWTVGPAGESWYRPELLQG